MKANVKATGSAKEYYILQWAWEQTKILGIGSN